MATTLRIHIIATFILACAAVALLVASFATPIWIQATITSRAGNSGSLTWKNDITYGLFTGQITGDRDVNRDLTMSCKISANVCIMSCQDNDDDREKELDSLLNDGVRIHCPFASEEGKCDGECTDFINAAVWVCSILFLALALLGAALAAVFAVVNTTTNPVEPILSVTGLYVWNGAGALFSLIVLALWGGMFASTLVDNIAYSETVTKDFTSEASLGVSYWLPLVAMFLLCGNVCILVVRQYQLAREPPPPTIDMEKNTDGIIFLY